MSLTGCSGSRHPPPFSGWASGETRSLSPTTQASPDGRGSTYVTGRHSLAVPPDPARGPARATTSNGGRQRRWLCWASTGGRHECRWCMGRDITAHLPGQGGCSSLISYIPFRRWEALPRVSNGIVLPAPTMEDDIAAIYSAMVAALDDASYADLKPSAA